MRVHHVVKDVVPDVKVRRRKQRRPFPYPRVERMWEQGKTIKQIAHAIGLIDKHNPKDPYHSLRNFLHRMHKGYRNGNGKMVKLPHRISVATTRAARKAGLKGPVAVRKNKKATQRAGLRAAA